MSRKEIGDERYQKDGRITEYASDEILKLYYMGFSIQHIGRILGLFHAAVRRVLRSRLANINKQAVCRKGVPVATEADTNIIKSYTFAKINWKRRIKKLNAMKKKEAPNERKRN